MAPPAFTFGVEIELLLRPKPVLAKELAKYGYKSAVAPTTEAQNIAIKKKDPSGKTSKQQDTEQEANRVALRKALADAITKAGVPTKLETKEYKEWTVKKEGSLNEVPDGKGSGFWAVELVSPILPAGNTAWVTQLGAIYTTLNTNCDILLSTGCSMHVHVAPVSEGGNGWYGKVHEQLAVLKAAAVFDDAMMKIMPADRKMNPWARSSFRDIPKTAPTDPDLKAVPALKKPFDEVPTKTWAPVFAAIDKPMKIQGQIYLRLMDQKRTMAMNFGAIDSYGTIEFRRPPGVKTAADAQKWAAFTVAFMVASQEPDWFKPWATRKTHATVAELQTFVNRGLQMLGWQGVLNPAVLVEDKSPATTLSHFELAEYKRKLAKAEKGSSFGDKISHSRNNTPIGSPANSPSQSPAGSPKPAPAKVAVATQGAAKPKASPAPAAGKPKKT